MRTDVRKPYSTANDSDNLEQIKKNYQQQRRKMQIPRQGDDDDGGKEKSSTGENGYVDALFYLAHRLRAHETLAALAVYTADDAPFYISPDYEHEN